MQSSSPYRSGWDREEVRLGATVNTFGNICVGIYGQWHHPINAGTPQYVAKSVSCDLGLIISNDGLHFREPSPGSVFIKRDQEYRWDRTFSNNHKQGNFLLDHGSIVNVDDTAYLYYSSTTPGHNVSGTHSNIGLETLDRDRFACFKKIPGTPGDGHVATCPMTLSGPANIKMNAEIIPGSKVSIELLDQHGLAVFPGFEARTAASSAIRIPIRWPNQTLPTHQAFRIRARLTGESKLYAIYVTGM